MNLDLRTVLFYIFRAGGLQRDTKCPYWALDLAPRDIRSPSQSSRPACCLPEDGLQGGGATAEVENARPRGLGPPSISSVALGKFLNPPHLSFLMGKMGQ